MDKICLLLCVALMLGVTNGKHVVMTKVTTTSSTEQTEFVPVVTEVGHGSFYLPSEDLSGVISSDDHHPHVTVNNTFMKRFGPESDHEENDHEIENNVTSLVPDHEEVFHEMDHEEHEMIEHENIDHEIETSHMEIGHEPDHKEENRESDHEEISHDELEHDNLNETISNRSGNFTETTTGSHDYHTETEELADLTVTDATGCLINLRDEMENKCFDKFQDVVIGAMAEIENQQVVCCAVEEYEKCSLRGFQKTHCEGDRQSLKESLKAARLFMAAMSNVSCSEHRGKCASSASVYTPGFLSISILIALIFILWS